VTHCHRDTLGACQHTAKQVVFVPVDGRLVFFFCLLLIAACVIWLVMLAKRGMSLEQE